MVDLESSLDKHAKQVLEDIGVYQKNTENFENLKKKVINSLREDYSNKVLKLFLRPRNRREIQNHDSYAEIEGPCGDTMEIYLVIKDKKIDKATFQTDGCIATVACGSIITELAKGKSPTEASKIGKENVVDSLGGLPKGHQHCALLAVNTLQKAIKDL